MGAICGAAARATTSSIRPQHTEDALIGQWKTRDGKEDFRPRRETADEPRAAVVEAEAGCRRHLCGRVASVEVTALCGRFKCIHRPGRRRAAEATELLRDAIACQSGSARCLAARDTTDSAIQRGLPRRLPYEAFTGSHPPPSALNAATAARADSVCACALASDVRSRRSSACRTSIRRTTPFW